MQELNARRQQYAARQKALSEQYDQVANQMQSVITDGIGQALGLPPDLDQVVTGVVNGKNLDEALTRVGHAMLSEATGAPEFAGVFGDYADEFQALQDTYRDAKEIADTVDRNAEVIRRAGEALSKGQMDKLLQAGVELYANSEDFLPDEYREDLEKWQSHWESIVEYQKPVQSLIALGRSIESGTVDESLRAIVEQTVRQELASIEGLPAVLPKALDVLLAVETPGDLMREDVLKSFLEASIDLSSLYKTLFAAVGGSADLRTRTLLVELFVATQPSAFLDAVREQPAGRERIDLLRRLAGVPDLTSLNAWLQRNRIGSLPGLYFDYPDPENGPFFVQIGVGLNTPSVQAIVELDVIERLSHAQFDVSEIPRERLAALLRPVIEVATGPIDPTNTEGEIDAKKLLTKAVVDLLPYDDLGQLVSVLAEDGKVTQEQLWTSFMGALPPESKDAATSLLSGLAASQSFFKDEKERRSGNYVPPSSFPPSATPGDQATNALAEAAVTYAMDALLPGAGTAFKVVTKVLASMSELDHIGDQIRNYQELIRQTYREQIHLMDMARESSLNISLQQLERELAQLVQRGAANQLASYQAALARGQTANQYARRSIQQRKALTFYLLERLREEFDQLDRTLGLWIGEGGRPYGNIADLVTSDPQLIRFAIDNDIHLYDWLDRDNEQSRADLQSSLAHWRQLYRLSRDICALHGCLPGNANLGLMAQTRSVSIRTLVPEEQWRLFETWQASGGPGGPFKFSLFLHRTWDEINPRHENHRVIDVRVGIRSPDGSIDGTSQVTLLHPGTSFVVVDGIPGTETLVPTPMSGFNAPDPFDLEALAGRWNVVNPSRRPLEGYGLFSNWELEVAASQETLAAEDVQIRFAYHFNEPQVTSREADYLVRLTVEDDVGQQETVKSEIWLNRSDFATFARRNTLEGRVSDLFHDPSLKDEITGLPVAVKAEVFSPYAPGTQDPSEVLGVVSEPVR